MLVVVLGVGTLPRITKVLYSYWYKKLHVNVNELKYNL